MHSSWYVYLMRISTADAILTIVMPHLLNSVRTFGSQLLPVQPFSMDNTHKTKAMQSRAKRIKLRSWT